MEEGRTNRCLFQLNIGVVIGDRARIGWTDAKAAEPAASEIRAAEMMVFMVLSFQVWCGGGSMGRGEGTEPAAGSLCVLGGALITKRSKRRG